MSLYLVRNKSTIAPLFNGWQETMIWSCLQDCMGTAYADSLENPKSAQIVIGDFSFFAGSPQPELVKKRVGIFNPDFIIMIPQNEDWAQLIESEYGPSAVRRNRYAFKKEPGIFHKEFLQNILMQLPSSYEVKLIDECIYEQIKTLDWAKDLCSQFKTFEEYETHGIGMAILNEGAIVSGASSYIWYKGGIEIEIDTREDKRRQGLGLACGAKLILECIEKNIYPSWDAQNKGSAALAEKLGYHFEKEYPVYEVSDL